ncbi:hypothetical protein VaNZ11_002574 [Volvox africanus]|uniref:Uncharacterized protein n=1 Tax=Volvox africanus TaxID=51714 RepID=A0ABQ5RS56_9CHLO|nr:hypothetical protein VaNZ11_002574 [Volvox africanus]
MSGSKKTRDVRDALLVNLSACKYPLVREAAERMGYEVVEDEAELWDLFWSDLSVSSDRVQRLLPFQRLNHFPGMLEICRKAALSRHMARMAARLPTEYRFYPVSLVLPDQLDELMAALKRNKARAEAAAAAASGGGEAAAAAAAAAAGVSTFILKPSAGTQGRGIALVQYPHQLAEAGDVGSCVAQAYVSSPLLLDGFKFDLRVYALVASVDPLRIHLYDEGLARLATEPYKPPSPLNLRTTTMHLTNYAVNKSAAGFISADTAPTGAASKRPMSFVLAQLAAQYGTTQEALQGSIADVVNKTVMAIQPLLAHNYHTSLSTTATAACPHACSCPSLDHVTLSAADPLAPCGCPPSLCFELLGFDILFDTQLQPWLLEVNHSPSFTSDSRLDRAVKGGMLARAIQMLGQQPEARRTFLEAEARAQSERLYSSPAGALSSGTSSGGGISSYTSPGAVMRRAQSALPRSRQLQAAVAALEEISANSTALLAAGGHVWGSGSGSSSHAAADAVARNGYTRPASSSSASASSPRNRQAHASCGGSGSGGGGGGGGGAKRSLSFTSGNDCSGGSLGIAGGFKVVFPSSRDDDRKRYRRILQTAADMYPQQRCQCPWCSRRREVSLLALTGQQLSLAASRPPSAVSGIFSHSSNYSHGLSGHLPVRPGSLSAQRRRSGLPTSSLSTSSYRGGGSGSATAIAASAAMAGEDGGSDTDGSTTASSSYHHHHVSAPGSLSMGTGSGASGGGGIGLSGGGSGAISRSLSHQDGPHGKPPRPGATDLRPASRPRGGPAERRQSPIGAGSSTSTSVAPASPGSHSKTNHNNNNNNYYVPPFPPAPTMASVLVGCTKGYAGGSAVRTVLQQHRTATAVASSSPPGSGGSVLRVISGEASTSEYGRVAAVSAGGNGGDGGASGTGYSQPSTSSTEDAANGIHAAQQLCNGRNHHPICLPEMYVHAGDTSPGSSSSLAESAAAAAADAAVAGHPHSRSNQMLSALRPLGHSKSHPQTRLGFAMPLQSQQQYPQELPQGPSASGRWPSRGGGGGGGGGACGNSGGSGGRVQARQRPSSHLSKGSRHGEEHSSGGSGGSSAGGGANNDPAVRSRTMQRQQMQQRESVDIANYGKEPGVQWSRGGGAGGRVGNGRRTVVAAAGRSYRTGLRSGGSADSSDASDEGDAAGSLHRSFSCSEIGVKGGRDANSSQVTTTGKAGMVAAGVHRSAAAIVAPTAVAARPWLVAPGNGAADCGGVGGGASSSAPAQFLAQNHGALTPTSGRSAYGSSGGGSEPSQDIFSFAGSGSAAAASNTFLDGTAGSKGSAAGGGAAAGGRNGSPTARRMARFGSSKRHGSSSGSPMSPADLELLLVRAKTTSALNNRFVTVYLQGGSNVQGAPRSPR